MRNKRPSPREEVAQIVAHLEKQGYISPEGRAQPALQTAVEQDSLDLPKEVAAATVEVAKAITSVTAASTAAAHAGDNRRLENRPVRRDLHTHRTDGKDRFL